MSHEEKCINCLRKADIGRPGAEILTPGGKIKKNPRLSYDISDSGCYAKCVKTCSRKLGNKNSFNKRTSRKKSKRTSRKKSKRVYRRRSRNARTSSKRTRKLKYNMTFGETPVFVFGTSQDQSMIFGGSQRTGVVLPGERKDRMIRSLSGEDVCKYFASTAAKLPQEVINRLRYQVLTDMKDYLKKKGSFLGFTDYHVWNNVFSDYTLKHFMSEINKDFLQRAFKLIDKKFLDGIFEKNNIYINVDYEDDNPSFGKRTKATTYPTPWSLVRASIYFNIKIMADDLLISIGKISSTGFPETNSLLSYLLVILEHEMVHALIAVFCYKDAYREDTSCYGCWENKIITCPKSGHNKIFMSILNNRFGHFNFAFDPTPRFSDTCFRKRMKEEDEYLTQKLAELSTMKSKVPLEFAKRLKNYFSDIKKIESILPPTPSERRSRPLTPVQLQALQRARSWADDDDESL